MLGGHAGVHQQAAQLVGGVGCTGLGGGLGDPVDRGHELLVLGAEECAGVDGPGGAAVAAPVDGPDASGAHPAQQLRQVSPSGSLSARNRSGR